MQHSSELGTESIGKLLIKQSVPASIGFLIMSIYSIVDTIFVGRFIGSLGIAGITVVMPISFLISSVGMAIGIGGASIISRALGSGDRSKANRIFGNQITLTLHFSVLLVLVGYLFDREILTLFGGKGQILPYALEYFRVILIGVPFLAWAMMANNVIRAQGRPKVAMLTMVIPAIINIILDPIFIVLLEMGMAGAAWATTISYMFSAGYTLAFFLRGSTEIRTRWSDFKLKFALVNEIASIGSITLARQGTISLLILVLNHSLFAYSGEDGVTIYGIINRVTMLALFPVIGVSQGFLPIAGYNYGARQMDRVRLTINTAIRYGTAVAGVFMILIVLLSEEIVSAFTDDRDLVLKSASALITVFIASPLVGVQMIGAGYFQAIGKALPAMLLTMTKQGFFLIPLVLVLPRYFDVYGIWLAFPIADVLSAAVTWWFLQREVRSYSPAEVLTG